MNNIKYLKTLIVCILLFFSSTSQSALFGPSNYNECIIDAMKGVTSDVAARAIKQSCRDKHSNRPALKDVTKDVKPKLEDVKGGFNEGTDGFNFYVQLYNGSSYVITSMILSISYKNKDGLIVSRKYKSYTVSSPMNTDIHRFAVNQQFKPTVILWDIETIEGYKN